ncbi:MAG: PEP-CTERM sorting domain-containing protein [Acetobacteraceae bacterium]|nr:PEP-CTERM sorting domain-containing protein [Pseudomonadota bacterium]
MRTLVLLGAAIGVLAAPAAKAAEFTFYDIPSSLGTVATGVNDSGQVAGYYQTEVQDPNPRSVNRGFTSTVATPGVVATVHAPGYDATQLFSINNAGVSAATLVPILAAGPPPTTGGTVGATYNGVFSPPIFPPQAVDGPLKNAFAQGVNTAGTVVGYYRDTASTTTFGFTFAGGVYTNPISNGGQPTFLTGINGAGTAVGYYQGGGTTHGITYNGLFSADIDVPGATDGTFATGLSDGGEVVGYFIDGSGTHGFVLVDGIFTTIDVPGALGVTQILGINNRHQVAGYYVNDEGKQIGFVAYVPEPGTMALFATGAFFLPFARRARARRSAA